MKKEACAAAPRPCTVRASAEPMFCRTKELQAQTPKFDLATHGTSFEMENLTRGCFKLDKTTQGAGDKQQTMFSGTTNRHCSYQQERI